MYLADLKEFKHHSSTVEDLKSLLNKLFQNSPSLKASKSRFAVHEHWATAVGERMARHAWPLKMLDGAILLVGTENSSWSQHLRLMEKDILARLNPKLSTPINGLRFCVSDKNPNQN